MSLAVLLLAGGMVGAQAEKTINVLPNLATWKAWPAFQQDFKKATGIKTHAIVAPSDTNEIKMKLTTMLASGYSTYDVMYIDELISVGFASDIIQRISTHNGKTCKVPVDTQPILLCQ